MTAFRPSPLLNGAFLPWYVALLKSSITYHIQSACVAVNLICQRIAKEVPHQQTQLCSTMSLYLAMLSQRFNFDPQRWWQHPKRLMIIAHRGVDGHRSRVVTEKALYETIFWFTMSEDIHFFVKSCTHWISTMGSDTIPLPLCPSLHCTKQNDFFQLDHIALGRGNTPENFILMLRNDHCGYSWFYPSPVVTSEISADTLSDCFAVFDLPKWLMSDNPTEFRSGTIRQFSKGLQMAHHFELLNSWSLNSAVEILEKALVRTARSMLPELQFHHDGWP